MKTGTRWLYFLPLALAALLLVPSSPAARAGDAVERGDEVPFDEADLYLELNDTDGDLGVHAILDGDAWQTLSLRGPRGGERMRVMTRGPLRRHGLTELFFESAEPSFDELSPEAFFRRFPAGEWEIRGTTIEGDELRSRDLLRHVLAAPAGNITLSGVPAAADCDAVPLPVVGEPVVIQWDPVTGSHPEIGEAGEIEVVKYQLVVEREDPSLLVFSVDLPPDVTAFEVPEDFTALGDEFKFEIVVREASGNQTATESCFEIE
jgi:hypothetical protein